MVSVALFYIYVMADLVFLDIKQVAVQVELHLWAESQKWDPQTSAVSNLLQILVPANALPGMSVCVTKKASGAWYIEFIYAYPV